MNNYNKLTNEELNDFTSRVVVQLEPTLTQQVMSLILELIEYRTKIENGTLIELPCKVGDSFYGIETNTIFKYSVLAIKIVENNAIHLCTVYDIEFVLGKDCFLTKAEAEKKLKELQKDDL